MIVAENRCLIVACFLSVFTWLFLFFLANLFHFFLNFFYQFSKFFLIDFLIKFFVLFFQIFFLISFSIFCFDYFFSKIFNLTNFFKDKLYYYFNVSVPLNSRPGPFPVLRRS